MVQSITRPGGSGVYCLQWKDKRIAYLYEIRSGRFEFYEMWNQEEWAKLAATVEVPSLLAALQKGADDDTLRLIRVIKTPSQEVRRTDYTLKGCLLSGSGTQKAIGAHLILSELIVEPPPIALHSSVTDSPTGSLPSETKPPVTSRGVISEDIRLEIKALIAPYLSVTHNQGAVHTLAQAIQEVLDR